MNARMIFDDSASFTAMLKLTDSLLHPYLDRYDRGIKKQFISGTNKQELQAELQTLDMLVIVAPKALDEGFFDDMQGLDCGIPVVVINIDTGLDVLKEMFGHIKRLIIIDRQQLSPKQADALVMEWKQERGKKIVAHEFLQQADEATGNIVRPLQFAHRSPVRSVPNRPAATVLDFRPKPKEDMPRQR